MDALPSRKNIRLTSYDYASPGAYFVTICTEHRRPILSEIVIADIPSNAVGDGAASSYNELGTSRKSN